MKKVFNDWKFLLGLFIAHILIFFTFDYTKVFWYLLTGATLFLISYSIVHEEFDDSIPMWKYLLYGIFSGFAVYFIFWLGNHFIDWLHMTYFKRQVTKLYSHFSPQFIWHFIVLVLIIVPGEEIFWRGFIQKRLLRHTSFWTSVFVSSLLYATVFIYSGFPLLIIAAFLCGIIWGALYAWMRSLPLVIISHLTFDLMLFVFLPLA